MIGITSYGAYIPRYRMSRKTISSSVGFMGTSALPGEKSIANWDEDSITMAVAAGIDCLQGVARNSIDGLFFATTSQPYLIRQNSTIISSALNLSNSITTGDFTTCTKSGTSALISAIAAVKSTEFNSIVVTASDCRVAKAGGLQEQLYGDGAAAVLVGNNNVIASFDGYYSLSYDFPDRWKSAGDQYERMWEDRFVRDEGYTKIIPQAIFGLLSKYKLDIKNFTKIIYPGIYVREHAIIAKTIGASSNQLQPTAMDTIGDTGSASPLLLFIAALEESKPGDKILVASYGNGCDALFFTVTEKIEKIRNSRRGFIKNLAYRKEFTTYCKYLTFRNALNVEVGIRGENPIFTRLSTLWREHEAIMSLIGTKCSQCGTPQFPPRRICINPTCGALDKMEPYPFSDKKGTLFSFTADNLRASIDPPSLYGIIDFDGGGRFWFDITDCELDQLKVGMKMEMTFRLKEFDKASGQHIYFWFATPDRNK